METTQDYIESQKSYKSKIEHILHLYVYDAKNYYLKKQTR
jgi:hypothetical protein